MSARQYPRIDAALLSCALFAVLPAHAQTYPVKPIRIVTAFASGGSDLVTRWLALKLAPVIGQQVITDPRTGAGGNIAHDIVAKAAPDGYTLLMGAPPVVINPHLNPKLAYDAVRDFAPIALLATIPNILVVHPSVPAKTMAELVQIARSHPGKLAYGSGGVGSTNHLAAELLMSQTKTRMVHVPYKGANLGLLGAMSGEVDVVITTMSGVAVSYVNQGKMRGLAILDTKRVSSLPQIPSVIEAGMPQLVAINWYILLAPLGAPREVVERLNMESVRIFQLPETRERLDVVGGVPVGSTPEQAVEFLRNENARWGAVIRGAGIKVE